ncbi:MAG: ribonuclease III [Victivallaceae bacterium]|nr:ribonuclease III [Victivallaceae bacterium]MDD3704059.1 ribonuclease III [Victivallaceae bacterium]MDD4318282.1 ribonuclease III [Victivallaceae bacterium]MDD5663815.1 ribonuclease III [Victivallaceae bacterium]
MAEDIGKLKYRINYEFKNRELLRKALTHRSYAVEHNLQYDNQRLEFLGDSVADLVLSEWLFNEYPGIKEGGMTKMRASLVCQDALAAIARHLNLGAFLLLGNGEIESGGAERDSTLSDLTEALIGAIYLDSGYENVRDWLIAVYKQVFPEPCLCLAGDNPKGMLQEYTQRVWNLTPDYSVVAVNGPDHNPNFLVAVSVNGYEARGCAVNRKAAEAQAAKKLLEILSERDPGIFN